MGKHGSEVHHLLLKIVYLNWVSKIILDMGPNMILKMLWSLLINKNVANLGARQSLEVQRMFFFAFFLDSFSASAKILAHLQVT